MRRLITILALFTLSCGGSSELDSGAPSDASASDSGIDASTVPRDAATDAATDAGRTTGLVPVDPPAEPVFPDVIDTISIAVRTATTTNAGTDDPIDLCVNATTCFDLDTPDIDDRQEGLVDVFHFSGLALPRSMVDRVTLRTRSPSATDNDRWTPACLDLRFDGEPVYCNDAIGAHIGTGTTAGEVPSWSDPMGLHEACTTCWNDTLTHGPVQGGNEADRVRVWVRADATRRVGLRMSEGVLDGTSPIVAWALPRPAGDFSAVLEVAGLEPGREYQYRVEVDSDTSEPARTIATAPPPDDTDSVRFAFGSCTRLLAQPAFAPLLAGDPDIFLFLGDIHYGNSRHQEAHRWQYRLFRAFPERAAFLADVPTLASWDDHDFVGNNSNGTCAGRAEALRAFTEYWANPPMGISGTPGAFFRHRWGPIEIFALDCRTYRPDVGDPSRNCTLDPTPPMLDPAAGPIGAAQRMWALDAIADSDATFKLVSCGSRFTTQGSTDSWASFPAARDAFLDALASRGAEGVVLLSGDIHRSEVRLIPRPAPSTGIVELTSSPVANVPSGCPAATAERLFCLDGTTSYIVADFDAAAGAFTARVHDGTGAVRFERTFPRSESRP